MPLIDRDLIRSYLQSFAVVLAMVTMITFVKTILDYYTYIFGSGESRLQWVLYYFVLTFPSELIVLLPISSAVSVLWVLAQKARDNEILAAFACGLSPLRLSRPFLLVGAVFSILALILSEFIASPAAATAHRVEKVRIKNRPDVLLTQRDAIIQKGPGTLYYLCDSYTDVDQTMRNASIVKMAADGSKPLQRITGERAVLRRTGEREFWEFQNAKVWEYTADGGIASFKTFPTLDPEDLGLKMAARLDRILSKQDKAERLSFREVWVQLDALESTGQRNPELKTAMHLKLSLPVATAFLIMLMCAHGIRPSHQSVLRSFGGGMLWIAFFFGLQMAFRALGSAGFIPAILAAWLPLATSGFVAVHLLRKARFA